MRLRYLVSGLIQDCGISIANALEIPQSCTKPSMCAWVEARQWAPCWWGPLSPSLLDCQSYAKRNTNIICQAYMDIMENRLAIHALCTQLIYKEGPVWLSNLQDLHWFIRTQFTSIAHAQLMITSSKGNVFRITGPLCGKFTGHRWIPLTKASDAELWNFLWSAPE